MSGPKSLDFGLSEKIKNKIDLEIEKLEKVAEVKSLIKSLNDKLLLIEKKLTLEMKRYKSDSINDKLSLNKKFEFILKKYLTKVNNLKISEDLTKNYDIPKCINKITKNENESSDIEKLFTSEINDLIIKEDINKIEIEKYKNFSEKNIEKVIKDTKNKVFLDFNENIFEDSIKFIKDDAINLLKEVEQKLNNNKLDLETKTILIQIEQILNKSINNTNLTETEKSTNLTVAKNSYFSLNEKIEYMKNKHKSKNRCHCEQLLKILIEALNIDIENIHNLSDEEIENKIVEFKNLLAQKEQKLYVEETVTEVMKKFGYENVMTKSISKREIFQNVFTDEENKSINTYIDEDMVMFEVVGTGEGDLNEKEKDNLFNEQLAFCSLFPEVVKELERRGVIIKSKKLTIPSKEIIKKIKIDKKNHKENRKSLFAKGIKKSKVEESKQKYLD